MTKTEEQGIDRNDQKAEVGGGEKKWKKGGGGEEAEKEKEKRGDTYHINDKTNTYTRHGMSKTSSTKPRKIMKQMLASAA